MSAPPVMNWPRPSPLQEKALRFWGFRALWGALRWHFAYSQGWRDVVILALCIGFATFLLAYAAQPNLILEERSQKEAAFTVATSQSLRIRTLETQVALHVTPTPYRYGCPMANYYCP